MMPVSIILKFLLPFVQRKVADRMANYLEDRRDRQLQEDEVLARPDGCPPCPPCPETAAETDSTPDTAKSAATISRWWYALSGLLLGSAFSVLAYFLMRRLAVS